MCSDNQHEVAGSLPIDWHSKLRQLEHPSAVGHHIENKMLQIIIDLDLFNLI